MNRLLPLLACAALLSSCAPATLGRVNQTPAPAPSAPLAAGQTWEVEGGSLAVGSRMTFQLAEVLETAPGIYSNLGPAALLAAQRGRAEQGATLYPAVSYGRLSQRLDFYWSDNGTDFNCRIENASPDAARLSGRLYLSGSEFGSCTAQLR